MPRAIVPRGGGPPRSAIGPPRHCHAGHAGTRADTHPAVTAPVRSTRDLRNEPGVGGAPDCGPPRFPLIVVLRRRSATEGANWGAHAVHRGVRSTEVVLQWRAVHRHGARRAHDGCARHRSGRQLLPSPTTASGDDAATRAGRHPLAEAVLASPPTAVRLIGTLHDLSLGALRHRVPTPTSIWSTRAGTTTAVHPPRTSPVGRMRSATTQDPRGPIESSDALGRRPRTVTDWAILSGRATPQR